MSHSPRPDKNITVRDIAAAVGVHHSTVSLALRNHPRISEATRAKVRQKADEMGYRPDPMLSALASYRLKQNQQKITSSLALLNAWSAPDKLRQFKEFARFCEGAEARAAELGYQLEEFHFGPKFPPAKLHRILQTRNIRGIILPPHLEQPDWGDFPWEHYSLIKYGRSLDHPGCHLVIPAHVTNTYIAYENILRLGYRRIGFVAFAAELRERRILFELGYQAAQASIDPAGNLKPFLFSSYDPLPEITQFRDWLEEEKPDAIFTTLPKLQNMIEAAGFEVPRDIGLAATTILDTPIPAGIRQNPSEIGRVAVSGLHSLMIQSQRGVPEKPRQVLVEGSWIDGETMPPRHP
ncbi:MAG: LacI family DNA-binding transcriptional regulator [Verrucomicrobiales bacterium]